MISTKKMAKKKGLPFVAKPAWISAEFSVSSYHGPPVPAGTIAVSSHLGKRPTHKIILVHMMF